MTTKKSAHKRVTMMGIKVCKDGPYLASGAIPLTEQVVRTDDEGCPRAWSEGHRYPTQERYALCRCGSSGDKPYCDGTHARIGFDGRETASRETYLDQAKETTGPELDLTDAHPLCVHAGFCDRAGGTWSLVERSDDPHARQIAIEEVHCCPSGRLAAWDKQGQPLEPELEPSIGVVTDQNGVGGPLWVRGGIPIESADGDVYEVRNRVTLCRCGRSANKPFCDGRHLDGAEGAGSGSPTVPPSPL
jgi:CDGSH-type Zn-finger protein